MAIIGSINGSTRKIYLSPSGAISGVLTFHPIDHVYVEYKALRASNESIRPYNAMMSAEGNLPKGGGKYTPRYLLLKEGAKLVIPAGISKINIEGEIITDDQTDPFDMSLVTGPCLINYKPAEAEIIKVVSSGNEYSLAEIAEAVMSYKR